MDIPVLHLPRPVPTQRLRPPQANIPQTLPERERIRRLAQEYVAAVRPVPPLTLEDLRSHSDEAVRRHALDPKYRDYLAVLLNSELWREQLATVPFERRLLLLPKCLRVEDKCPAPFDEFGLLCKQCGLCSIQDLQSEAERLGYAVLVAEGSAIVMALIQTGKIDAIVGVSCLSVLEKAFPYMESAAVPGVAIPLLQDDCKDTTVDLDWIWEVLHLTSDDRTRRLDLDGLRREVNRWFEPSSLEALLPGGGSGETVRIAREWLARAGKRWRPFLAVCAWKALQEDPETPFPQGLKELAVAVECFHKASLIHDDIEDNDALRYGEKALHEEHGMPVALNVGDLLLGEGYRLLAGCPAPAEVRARLFGIASAGHRTLCLGQGAELSWARDPRPLGHLEVLEIFRQKTAPAFEVALKLGAAYAGAPEEIFDVLTRYSEALGIGYQIRDDLEDLESSAPLPAAPRPSLPLALVHERSRGEDRALVERSIRSGASVEPEAVRKLLRDPAVEGRCRGLLESYKEEAVRSLAELENASLKGLLRRVIGKIFSLEIKGWCSEFEARNVAGRAAREEAPR
jgi:geranylgeranyl pyrophosphate synthase